MIQESIRFIQTGKDWSWSLIGIAAILGGLLIRSLLLRDILHGMKIRNRSWYKRTQTYYQKRSILGWMFFSFFLLGAMLFWRFEAFFLRYLNFVQWMLVLVILFMLSLFCHIRAYARAIIEAMEEHVATDKDL